MKNKLTDEQIKDFRKKLSAAFRALRRRGFVAKQNFQCCQGCAWSDLPDENQEPDVVFYHHQDNADIPDGYVYLAFRGRGQEIIYAMEFVKLPTVWDGKSETRIKVLYTEPL